MIHPCIEFTRGGSIEGGQVVAPSTIWMADPLFISAAALWGLAGKPSVATHFHGSVSGGTTNTATQKILLTCRSFSSHSTANEEAEEQRHWDRQSREGQLNGIESVIWVYLADKGARHKTSVVYCVGNHHDNNTNAHHASLPPATKQIVEALANVPAVFTAPQQIAALVVLRCLYRPQPDTLQQLPPAIVALLDQCLYQGDNNTFSALLKHFAKELLLRSAGAADAPSKHHRPQDALSLTLSNASSKLVSSEGNAESQTSVSVMCSTRRPSRTDAPLSDISPPGDLVVLLLTTNRAAITTALVEIVNQAKEAHHRRRGERGGKNAAEGYFADSRLAVIDCGGGLMFPPTSVGSLPPVGQILSLVRFDVDVELPPSDTRRSLPQIAGGSSNPSDDPAVVSLRMEKGMRTITSLLAQWNADGRRDFLSNINAARGFALSDLFAGETGAAGSVAQQHLTRMRTVCVVSDATTNALTASHFNPLSIVRRNVLVYGTRFSVIRLLREQVAPPPRAAELESASEKQDVLRQLAYESGGIYRTLSCEASSARDTSFDEAMLAAHLSDAFFMKRASPMSSDTVESVVPQRVNLAVFDAPCPRAWPGPFEKVYPSARVTGIALPSDVQAKGNYVFSLALPKLTYANTAPSGGYCIRLSSGGASASTNRNGLNSTSAFDDRYSLMRVTARTSVTLPQGQPALLGDMSTTPSAVVVLAWAMHPGRAPLHTHGFLFTMGLVPVRIRSDTARKAPPLMPSPMFSNRLLHVPADSAPPSDASTAKHVHQNHKSSPQKFHGPLVPAIPLPPRSPHTSAPNSGRVTFANIDPNRPHSNNKAHTPRGNEAPPLKIGNDEAGTIRNAPPVQPATSALKRGGGSSLNPTPRDSVVVDNHNPLRREQRSSPSNSSTRNSTPRSPSAVRRQHGSARPSPRDGYVDGGIQQQQQQYHHQQQQRRVDSSDDDEPVMIAHTQPVMSHLDRLPITHTVAAHDNYDDSIIRNAPPAAILAHSSTSGSKSTTPRVANSTSENDIRDISRIPSRHTGKSSMSSAPLTPRNAVGEPKRGSRRDSSSSDEGEEVTLNRLPARSPRPPSAINPPSKNKPHTRPSTQQQPQRNSQEEEDDDDTGLVVSAITARPTSAGAALASQPTQQMYVDDRWIAVGRSTPSASSFDAAITPSEPPGAVTSKSFSLSVKRFSGGVVYIDTHLKNCEGLLADLSESVTALRGPERTPIITQKLILCVVERGVLMPVQRETIFDGVVDSPESIRSFWSRQHRPGLSEGKGQHKDAGALGTEHAFYNLDRGKDYCVVHLLTKRYPQRHQDIHHQQDFRNGGDQQYRVAGSLAPPLSVSQWLSKEDFIVADGVQFTTPTLFVEKVRVQEVHPRAVALNWDGNSPKGAGYLVTFSKLQPTQDCLRQMKELYREGKEEDALTQPQHAGASGGNALMSEKYCRVPNGIHVVSAPHIPPVTKIVSAGGCVSAQIDGLEPASVYRITIVPNSGNPSQGALSAASSTMPLSAYPLQAADAEEIIVVTAPDMNRNVIVPCAVAYRNPASLENNSGGDGAISTRVQIRALLNLPRLLLENWFGGEQEIYQARELTTSEMESKSSEVAEFVVDFTPSIWVNDGATNETVTLTGLPVGVEVRFELTATCPQTNNSVFRHKPGYVFRCGLGPFHTVRRLIASSVSANEARFFWEGSGRSYRLTILRRRRALTTPATSAKNTPRGLVGNHNTSTHSADNGSHEDWVEDQCIHVDHSATSHLCTNLGPDTTYRAIVTCDGCVAPAECVFSTSPPIPSIEELRMALVGQANNDGIRLPTPLVAVHNLRQGCIVINLPRRTGKVSHLVAKVVPAPFRQPTIIFGGNEGELPPYLPPSGIGAERGTFWSNDCTVQSICCDVREAESAGQVIFAQLQFAAEAAPGVKAIQDKRIIPGRGDPYYAPQRLLESDPISLYAVTNLSLQIDASRPVVELRFTCGQKTGHVSAGIGRTFTAATAGSRAIFNLEDIRGGDRSLVQEVIVEGTSIMPEQCSLYALIPPVPVPENCFNLEVYDDRALVSVDPEMVRTILEELIPQDMPYVRVQLEFTSTHLPTVVAPLPLVPSSFPPNQISGKLGKQSAGTNLAMITSDGDVVVPLSPKRAAKSTLSVLLRVIGFDEGKLTAEEAATAAASAADRIVFVNNIATSLPTLLETPLVHDITSVTAHSITSTTAEIHWESSNELFEIKVFCKSAGIQPPPNLVPESNALVEAVGAGRNGWRTHHRRPLPGVLVYATRTSRAALQLEGLLPDKMYEVVITGNQGGSHEGRFAFATPPVVSDELLSSVCESFSVSADGTLSMVIPARDKKVLENMGAEIDMFEAGIGVECQTTDYVVTVYHDSVDAVSHLCFPDHKHARRAQRRGTNSNNVAPPELRDFSRSEWRLPPQGTGNPASVVVDLFPMLHISNPPPSNRQPKTSSSSSKPSPSQLVQDGLIPYVTLHTDSYIEFSRRKTAEVDGGKPSSMGTSASSLGVPVRIDVLGVPSVDFSPDGQFATVAWAGSSQSYSVTVQNRAALDMSTRPHQPGPHNDLTSDDSEESSSDVSTQSDEEGPEDGYHHRPQQGSNKLRVTRRDEPLEQTFSKAAPTMTLRCADFPSTNPTGNVLFITVRSSKHPSNVLRFSVVIPRPIKPLGIIRHLPASLTVDMRPPVTDPQNGMRNETYLKIVASPVKDTVVGTSLHELPRMAQYPGFGDTSKPLTVPLPKKEEQDNGSSSAPASPFMHIMIAEKTTFDGDAARAQRRRRGRPWEQHFSLCLNPVQVVSRAQGLPALTNVGGLRIEEVTTRTATVQWNSIDDEFHCLHKCYRPVESPHPLDGPSGEDHTVTERNIIVSTPILKLRNLPPGSFHTVVIRGRRSGDAVLVARFFTLPQLMERSVVFRRHENGKKFTVLVDDDSVGLEQYLHLPTATDPNQVQTYRVETTMELVLCNALDGGVSETFLIGQTPLTSDLVEDETTVVIRKRIMCVAVKPQHASTPRTTPRTPRNMLEEDDCSAEQLQTETHAFVCKVPKPVDLSHLKLLSVSPNTAALRWAVAQASQQQQPHIQFTVSVNPMETYGNPRMVKRHLTVVGTPEIHLTSLTDATLYRICIEVNGDVGIVTAPPTKNGKSAATSFLARLEQGGGDNAPVGPHPALVIHDDCPPVTSITKYFVTPSRKVITNAHRRFPGGVSFLLDPCLGSGDALGRPGAAHKIGNAASHVSMKAFSAVRIVPDNVIYVHAMPRPAGGDVSSSGQSHNFPPTTVTHGQPPTYIVAPINGVDDGSGTSLDGYQVEVPVREPVGENSHRLEFYRAIETSVIEDLYADYEPGTQHPQPRSRPATIADVLNPIQWNEPDVQTISLVRVVSKPHCMLCTTSKAHVRWSSSTGQQPSDFLYAETALSPKNQKMIFDVVVENITDDMKAQSKRTAAFSDMMSDNYLQQVDPHHKQRQQVQRVAKEEVILEGLAAATAYNICISPSLKDCPCEPLHFVLVTAPKRPKHLSVQITQLSALFEIPPTVILSAMDGNAVTVSTTAVVICDTDTPTAGCSSATDFLAKGQTRNIFRSTPNSSQRVDIRLRSSKRYKFVFFTSVHHPESITGVMHSKPHIIDHETQSFPPQNLHLVSRTKASVTVGWTTLDFGSKSQVFEAQMAPLPKAINDHDPYANAPLDDSAFLEQAFLMAGDELQVKEVSGQKTTSGSVPSLHCTFSGKNMNPHTLYAFRVRQVAIVPPHRRADPTDVSSLVGSSTSRETPFTAWSNLLVTSPLAAPNPARHLHVTGVGSNFVSLQWSHRRGDGRTRVHGDRGDHNEEITFLISCFEHHTTRHDESSASSVGGGIKHRQRIHNLQRAAIAGHTSIAAASILYGGSDSSDEEEALRQQQLSRPRREGPVAEQTTTETASVIDGLEPATVYRIVVIPSNHYGEQCPSDNAEIIVRTEGTQAPWK